MIGGLGNEIVDKYELSILCSIYVGHVKSKNLEIEKEISCQCTFTKSSMIHDHSRHVVNVGIGITACNPLSILWQCVYQCLLIHNVKKVLKFLNKSVYFL
jgi:hypothetical protein